MGQKMVDVPKGVRNPIARTLLVGIGEARSTGNWGTARYYYTLQFKVAL
jgi:hypothetical protein